MSEATEPAQESAPSPDAISDATLVNTGIWLAWKLGYPFRIEGARVYVPTAMGNAIADELGIQYDVALRQTPVTLADDPAHDVNGYETPRRIAYLIALAQKAIDSTGSGLGLITVPEPSETDLRSNATSAPVRAQERIEPLPIVPVVRWIGDAAIVDKWLEVRSDTGVAWHVVRLDQNKFVSWHPTREAALANAIEVAKDNPYGRRKD